MSWGDALYLLPEIVISIGACLLLIAPVSGFRNSPNSAKWSMLVLLAITAASVFAASYGVQSVEQTRGFARMFALDPFSIFFKLLLIVTMAMITLLSDGYLRRSRYASARRRGRRVRW